MSGSSRAKRGLPERRVNKPWELTSSSIRDTDRLGRALGQGLRGGEILALFGPLGAGKTTLVRGIAIGSGAPLTAVSSPTFVFIHEYRGRLPLAHVDLYRIASVRELESTGLEEYLSGPTVTVIEWADKASSWLPNDCLEIELRHLAVRSRTIRLTARGPVSAALLRQAKVDFDRTAAGATNRRLTRKGASPT